MSIKIFKLFFFRCLAVISTVLLECFALTTKVFNNNLWVITFWLSLLYLIIYGFIPFRDKRLSFRLNVSKGGYELFIVTVGSFCVSLSLALISYFFFAIPEYTWGMLLLNLLFILIISILLLINSTLRMFFASRQLGMYNRALFLLMWWLPVVNILIFYQMAKAVKHEYESEEDLIAIDDKRIPQEICKTKYPLVLIHGVFFRDSNFFNYWGRIPKELKKNGAQVYYGLQESALSVKDSAAELKERILKILADTKSEKVNIIAHSKGGLDARYAISVLGLDQYVASLTTINTPHHGCEFAEYLFHIWPKWWVNLLAKQYNGALRKLGDKHPDFLGACWDLTKCQVEELNKIMPDKEKVFYQSSMSMLSNRKGGSFPLNLTYNLVKKYDGENDGLVGIKSGQWQNFLGVIEGNGKIGISHADMIDSMQRNIPGFDTRRFYVQLVQGLKEKGL